VIAAGRKVALSFTDAISDRMSPTGTTAIAPVCRTEFFVLPFYIVSTNVNRRHMTKGQRAMAVAIIAPEPESGGRGKTVRLPDGLNKQRISEARIVRKWAPELAQAVLSGAHPLDKA
jgi:hypothetical protein